MDLLVKEAAEKRGVSVMRIRQHITRKELKAHKRGSQWFIRESDLAKLPMNASGRPPRLKIPLMKLIYSHGLTAAKLGEKVGCTHATIYNVAKGKCKDQDIIQKITKYLGVESLPE